MLSKFHLIIQVILFMDIVVVMLLCSMCCNVIVFYVL